jgi:chromosomal replication initiator protein
MSIGIRDIERAVCQRFHLTAEQLRGRDVRRKIARPRQIAMYLVRDMTDASLHQVARHFGDRDHTTVIHAARRVAKLIEDGRTMPRYLDEIRAILAAMTPHKEVLHQQIATEDLVTRIEPGREDTAQ